MAYSERALYQAACSALESGNPKQLEDVVRELRTSLAKKIEKPKTHPVAGEEYKTCAEYWAEGAEPPASHTKRPVMSTLGAYTTIRVTFTDGTFVRCGTFETDKAGNPELTSAIRFARTLRMSRERRRAVADLKVKRAQEAQAYRADTSNKSAYRKAKALTKEIERLETGHWVDTPLTWRQVLPLLPIPEIASVEIIDPHVEQKEIAA